MKDLALRVRGHWIAEGLDVVRIGSSAIASLRQRFPSEGIEGYLQFLSFAGLPKTEDVNQFRFWMPKEIAESAELLKRTGALSAVDADAERGMVFADHMQESWWYRIVLDGSEVGMVRRAGCLAKDRQAPPIGTIWDFLAAYLRDDEVLYPMEQ